MASAGAIVSLYGRAGRWAAHEVASGLAAPITNRVADGADVAMGAFGVHDEARSTLRGARGLYRTYRADRDRTQTRVNGEWFHGGEDRMIVLAQLGVDVETFRHDLAETATYTPDGTRATDAQWVVAEVAPMLAEWQAFVARLAASPLAAYVTEWRVFVEWHSRLRRLRDAARVRGIHLASAEPAPLPKTVWQRGADGTGSTIDTWLSMGKKVVFGAITITGLVGLFVTARNLRRIAAEKLST